MRGTKIKKKLKNIFCRISVKVQKWTLDMNLRNTKLFSMNLELWTLRFWIFFNEHGCTYEPGDFDFFSNELFFPYGPQDSRFWIVSLMNLEILNFSYEIAKSEKKILMKPRNVKILFLWTLKSGKKFSYEPAKSEKFFLWTRVINLEKIEWKKFLWTHVHFCTPTHTTTHRLIPTAVRWIFYFIYLFIFYFWHRHSSI